MVMTPGTRGRTRGKIQIGADDPSLTAAGGMLAVTELCGRLGLIEALDAEIGPVKQRKRGFTGGQVLTGMAAAQLAGEDFLVGLDRLRADEAGQQVTPVPGLATSTATGLARRLQPGTGAAPRPGWRRRPRRWRACYLPSAPRSWRKGR